MFRGNFIALQIVDMNRDMIDRMIILQETESELEFSLQNVYYKGTLEGIGRKGEKKG